MSKNLNKKEIEKFSRQIILKNIDYWKEAPVWTPDKIATATQDWFKYLGNNV